MKSLNSACTVPEHIAVIMDGNRRWAKQRGLPAFAGHFAGAKRIRSVVQDCAALGVSYLTVFAFSTENWKRPPAEVSLLLGLLRRYLQVDVEDLAKQGVRIKIVGDQSRFDARTQQLIRSAEDATQKNGAITLTIAVNYGGRWDVLQAARAWSLAHPQQCASTLTEGELANYLSMAFAPPPQLLIRTGGESRVSNFMLWQLAHSELVFSDCLWPDFSEAELHRAIERFAMSDTHSSVFPAIHIAA